MQRARMETASFCTFIFPASSKSDMRSRTCNVSSPTTGLHLAPRGSGPAITSMVSPGTGAAGCVMCKIPQIPCCLRLGECVSQQLIDVVANPPGLLDACITADRLRKPQGGGDPQQRFDLLDGRSAKTLHERMHERKPQPNLSRRRACLVRDSKPVRYGRVVGHFDRHRPFLATKEHFLYNLLRDDTRCDQLGGHVLTVIARRCGRKTRKGGGYRGANGGRGSLRRRAGASF